MNTSDLSLPSLDSRSFRPAAGWVTAIVFAVALIPLSIARAGKFFPAVLSHARLPLTDFGSLGERTQTGAVLTALVIAYGLWVWKHFRHDAFSVDQIGVEQLLDRVSERRSFLRVLNLAGPFILLAWLVYPYSGDVRMYLHYGAMLNAGINPATTRADAFVSPWSATLAWGQSSAYGPIALLLFSVAARLQTVGHGALLSWQHTVAPIYAFKLMCVGFHVLTVLLIGKALAPREDRWAWAMLYAINPIILFEQVGEAHIDVAVATLLMATLLAVKHNRWTLAGAAILTAALVKTVALIWIPLLGIEMLRKKRYRAAATSAALALAVAVGLWLTLLPTADAWLSLLNVGVGNRVSESFPSLVFKVMAHPLHVEWNLRNHIVDVLSTAMKGSFMIVAAIIAWRLWRRKEITLAEVMVQATVWLFVLASPWYRPWYATVLLLPTLWLAASFWYRAAIIALVLGGEISNAVLTGVAIDAGTSLPVMACLFAALTVQWWPTTRSAQRDAGSFDWDEPEIAGEMNGP